MEQRRKPSFLIALIRFIVGIVEAIIGLRILLTLFSANPSAPFVQLIYDLSEPLLYPFRNIFPTREFGDQFVIEFSAVFALIIYSIIGSILVRAIVALESGAGKR
ncbi:YggT family protein [Alkalihalobacillus sp. CinArs1]|uniref:YggT family protein n=1 Tax=Alkalihalobacillus sp. CinArs1 TaxID=2995314 RepID=UPI0022DE4D17|nr:YggT family protein [Alkalihalobacillus sp. CinArs1]